MEGRVLAAVVPIRGANWSGLRGVTVARWSIDTVPMIMASVRVTALLDGATWLPGYPGGTFRGFFLDSPPEPDDAVPIKGSVDVTVSFGGAAILARSAVEVFSGAARATPIEQRERLVPGPLDPERNVVIARDLEQFHASTARLAAVGAELGWTIDGAVAAQGKLGFAIGARADFVDGDHVLFTTSIDSVRVRPGDRAVDLVFRGIFVEEPGRLLERIVVGVVPETRTADTLEDPGAAAPSEWGPLLDAGLPVGGFALAANVADANAGTRPPELTVEERDAARLSAFSEGPGEPSLTPEEYGEISRELATRPRKDVLAERGLDEIAWTREEWAVAEILASAGRASIDPPGSDEGGEDAQTSLDPLAAEWTEAMKPAPSGAAAVGAPVDLEPFAKLQAHVAAREPGKVLAEAGMTVAGYLVLEAEVGARLDRDEDERARFEAMVARHRPDAEALAAREERETLGEEDS